MSAEEKDQTGTKDTPELSEEGKEKVRRMQAAYDDDRPTAVLPGTDNTITGVAVSEWLDDDGNPTWEIKRPAELGGLRFYNFEEGRKYRLPRPLADHLDEHGYVFHRAPPVLKFKRAPGSCHQHRAPAYALA